MSIITPLSYPREEGKRCQNGYRRAKNNSNLCEKIKTYNYSFDIKNDLDITLWREVCDFFLENANNPR